MKKLFIAVAAIAAAVACNTAEIVDLPSNPAIAFENAFIQNASRVGTTTETLEAFDVWAYINEKAGTVLTDEDVTKANGQWGYANLQYWAPGHMYYFTALAPMNSANWDLDFASDVVSFTNVDGTEDLLYATAQVSTADLQLGGEMEPVALTFDHLLSKVNFTFKNGFATDNVKIQVKNVTMTAVKAAQYTLGAAEWTNATDADLTLKFGDVETLASGVAASVADERLTIPTAADYVYGIKFYVDVYFGAVKAIADHEFNSTLTGAAFEIGKAYNLSATINQENLNMPVIEFTLAEVKDWVDAGTQTPSLDYVKNGDVYYVKNANGLKLVAEGINNGTIASNVTIVLNSDIDLAELQESRAIESNWTPLGNENFAFEGTFDGNGKTIKNFNYVADEPVYFVGLIGCAQNATIKNLVVENINLVFASDVNGVGGTIGGVVGGLYGTSTLENITVKGDVQIIGELDKKGAGRIGAVVGGNEGTNNVVVKNVCVEANAGSLVQGNNAIGGIAGQLQGAAAFTNCSSNIDVKAGQYFAGGIEGLSADKSTFVNCASAGNVSVVAGRAGNANDLYRVGGITGGWADGKGKTLVLTNCSYAGTISGQDAAGAVAETLDCAGYVGRGYAAAAGSKVSVNGIVYTYKGNGVYSANGYFASNAAELQAALDAAVNGDTIVLTADIEGNVVATQKADVKVTLDGAGYELAGYIVVDGKSATLTTAGITIKNVNFVADAISADACVRLGDGTTATRYACNVSVVGCTFDVPGAVAVKSYTGGDKNLVISECTATANAHSLLQAAGIDGILVEKCTVNSKNGLNFNSSNNVVINECNVDTKGYCARFGANSGAIGATEYEISNSSLKSLCDDGDAVIILRANTANSTLNLVNTTLEGEIKLTNAAGAKVYVDGVLM